MKKSDKISPLEELRAEKEQLKSEFAATEEQMLAHVDYVANNFGSILLNTFLGSFGQHFKKSSSANNANNSSTQDEQTESINSSSVMQTVWAGLQVTYPYLIEIAKPIVLAFVTSKIKGIFTKKNKK